MKKKLLLLAAFVLLNIPFISHAECIHDWTDFVILEPSTCASNGKMARTCKKCGVSDIRTTQKSSIHTWGDWIVIRYPGCIDETGLNERSCKVCDKVEFQTIPAYGSHDWGEWIISDIPTCGSTGWQDRQCKRCDATDYYVIPIDPNNHVLSDWAIEERSTALEKGILERHCECGQICEEKSIPKLKAKVKLSTSKISLASGKSTKIRVKQKTRGDYIKKWKSSNKNIVSVTSSGKLKALKKGTATITVVMESNAKAKCKITVK